MAAICSILEKGELATSYEEADDPDMTEDERKLAEEVSYFVLGCLNAVPSTDDILATFCTIARHVLHHVQARVIFFKENQSGDVEALTAATAIYEDSADVLFRICGDQLNKIIVLRKETLKTKQESKS